MVKVEAIMRRALMPKAKTAKNCYRCEEADRIKRTFMICARCGRFFCSDHGTPDLEQCELCLEAGEETT
jgi:hypothetical protein